MNTVSEDFPHPGVAATVPGTQENFVLAHSPSGRLVSPLGSCEERYQRCVELAEWAETFLCDKLAKPKYASLSWEHALEKLRLTMRAEFFDLSAAEITWILSRLDRQPRWRENAEDACGCGKSPGGDIK